MTHRGVLVELSPSEQMLAALIACMRQITDVRDGRQPAHGAGDEFAWHYNIIGALGEVAVAKDRDCFWSGAQGRLRAPDVGALQVRATPEEDGRLIVRKNDPDDVRFVLVVGVVPCLRLVGWMLGKDAKRDEWRANPNGRASAWFVPQDALADYGTLWLP